MMPPNSVVSKEEFASALAEPSMDWRVGRTVPVCRCRRVLIFHFEAERSLTIFAQGTWKRFRTDWEVKGPLQRSVPGQG